MDSNDGFCQLFDNGNRRPQDWSGFIIGLSEVNDLKQNGWKP